METRRSEDASAGTMAIPAARSRAHRSHRHHDAAETGCKPQPQPQSQAQHDPPATTKKESHIMPPSDPQADLVCDSVASKLINTTMLSAKHPRRI